jgi:hypothetical protein
VHPRGLELRFPVPSPPPPPAPSLPLPRPPPSPPMMPVPRPTPPLTKMPSRTLPPLVRTTRTSRMPSTLGRMSLLPPTVTTAPSTRHVVGQSRRWPCLRRARCFRRPGRRPPLPRTAPSRMPHARPGRLRPGHPSSGLRQAWGLAKVAAWQLGRFIVTAICRLHPANRQSLR